MNNIFDMKHNVKVVLTIMIFLFFWCQICKTLIVMMMEDGSGQLVTNTQYPNRRCRHSCCCHSTRSTLHFSRDILGTIVNIFVYRYICHCLVALQKLRWKNAFLFWPKFFCLTAKDQTATGFNLRSLLEQARKP